MSIRIEEKYSWRALKKMKRRELLELLLAQNRRLEALEAARIREGKDAEQGEAESPSAEALETELARVSRRSDFRASLRSTVYGLLTVSAVSVLVAVLLLPVLRIYGNSMNPTLSEGDIVLSVKQGEFNTGDIIAFYYNNKILVKRVIAGPGDWVDISPDGTVFVNEKEIDEPYLTGEKALGDCNITLPYQVPDSRIFVMGDNRSVSVDSRNTSVGCVAEEQIVGRIVFELWPLERFGPAA